MSGFIAQAARQARGRPSVCFSGRTDAAIPFVRAFQGWKEQTASLLKTLTPREEKIIKRRFGLEDGSQHTLEEVGQTFALTRERIRQIEAKALRKLATPRARANSASSPPAARENNTRLPLRPKLEKGSRARGELGATFSESFSGCALRFRVPLAVNSIRNLEFWSGKMGRCCKKLKQV